MNRLIAPLFLIALLGATGCSRIGSDSGLNPLKWFGGSSGPETLEPKDGYASTTDPRPGIPAITGASWQRMAEGRLLVVTAMAPTKGYWDAELIAASPAPAGRLRPDADGTLRLRLVAWPPAADSAYATMPASPATDSITTAVALSNATLAGISRVEISGSGNSVTILK